MNYAELWFRLTHRRFRADAQLPLYYTPTERARAKSHRLAPARTSHKPLPRRIRDGRWPLLREDAMPRISRQKRNFSAARRPDILISSPLYAAAAAAIFARWIYHYYIHTYHGA